MLYRFQSRGQLYEIGVERLGDIYRITSDGDSLDVELIGEEPGQVTFRIGERQVRLYWATDGINKWISLEGCTYRLERPSHRTSRLGREADGSEVIRAPMPAQVRGIQVAVGETVEKGQTLLLLEAMKMEIRIRAPAAGKIKHILVSTGQPVDKDQVLVEIGG